MPFSFPFFRRPDFRNGENDFGFGLNNNQWDRRTVLQLSLLILIVPAQLILTDWLGTPEFQRSDMIRRMVTNAQFYYEKYCVDVSSWRKALKIWVYTKALNIEDIDEIDLTKKKDHKEVNNAKSRDGLLGASMVVHSPRAVDVHFRVGQVIKHKLYNYRAVIIGWDERPKAPKDWFTGAVPEKQMATYLDQPFYSVLIDTRDRAPQTTYVPSANIQLLPNNRIIHPSVDDYFEYFDGYSQYVMRPWLKRIYPHDGP
ncbi:uncharacterized protein LOC142337849 isoform X2 [Convolutriloba macropyga]|uniref:uncharacterized protein LOC142337849 isoform X2 n=1 Tax=Convolutriloba macropyga TaxID=536237 RepID=UPI003F52013E